MLCAGWGVKCAAKVVFFDWKEKGGLEFGIRLVVEMVEKVEV